MTKTRELLENHQASKLTKLLCIHHNIIFTYVVYFLCLYQS